jgi:hypothetical protein
MTRNYPMVKDVMGEPTDHPHHRSLWFAHGSVSGKDFWLDKPSAGMVKSTKEPETSIYAGHADLFTNNDWLTAEGEEIARDQTLIRFSHYSDKSRVIDYIVHFYTPTNKPVIFGDTKEGTMAIRTRPALNLKGEGAPGKAINSEGDKDFAVWGKRAKWVAYWGQIDGKTCGVAIFDSPDNLRHPTWWHARDYGLVAANPFGIHDFEKKKKGTGDYTLEANKELTFRYRFVFFEGTPAEADIAGKYEFWSEPKVPENEKEKE